jgi:serine protease Do
VITEIHGKDITTLSEYTSLLNQLTPGGVLHVTARRRGAEGYEELTFDVVLGEH